MLTDKDLQLLRNKHSKKGKIYQEGDWKKTSEGNLMIFKNGRWVDFTKLTVSTSAFYDF
jgi:hypothetical protein